MEKNDSIADKKAKYRVMWGKCAQRVSVRRRIISETIKVREGGITLFSTFFDIEQ